MSTAFTKNAVGALTTVIDGVATTGLRNLATATARLGPAVTPGATPGLEVTYRLKAKYGANLATTGIQVAQCWYVRDVANDGNYENVGVVDGSTTIYPVRAPDFVFYWDTNTAHGSAAIEYMASVPAVLMRPACNHKILFRSTAGQTTTNANDTDNILSEMVVNDLGT
jgi:hypothetical protein